MFEKPVTWNGGNLPDSWGNRSADFPEVWQKSGSAPEAWLNSLMLPVDWSSRSSDHMIKNWSLKSLPDEWGKCAHSDSVWNNGAIAKKSKSKIALAPLKLKKTKSDDTKKVSLEKNNTENPEEYDEPQYSEEYDELQYSEEYDELQYSEEYDEPQYTEEYDDSENFREYNRPQVSREYEKPGRFAEYDREERVREHKQETKSGTNKALVAVVAVLSVTVAFMGGMLFNRQNEDVTNPTNTIPPDNYNSDNVGTSAEQNPQQSYGTAPVIEESNRNSWSWADAYAEQLRRYKESSDFDSTDNMGSMYDLFDVNGDYIPELFISDGSYHSAYCNVYTFLDSECINIINDNYAYGTLYIAPDKNLIIHHDSNMGNNSLYVTKFDGEYLTSNTFNDNLGNAGYEPLSYQWNNMEVSANDYVTTYNSYVQNNLYTVGRLFDFNSISAENIAENYRNGNHSSATIATLSTPSLYYVRQSWSNADSQIGAYANLENAKNACQSGYSVFDESGRVIYEPPKSEGVFGDGLGADERVDFKYGIIVQNGGSVALLESASSGSSAKCYMRDGDGVEVLSQDGNWYYINYFFNGSYNKGYVSKDCILKTAIEIYNINPYSLGLIDGTGVAGFKTSYVTMNGEKSMVRTTLGDGWHVEARHWCRNHDVMWYELWDSQDGDYYGWVDSDFISFYSY